MKHNSGEKTTEHRSSIVLGFQKQDMMSEAKAKFDKTSPILEVGNGTKQSRPIHKAKSSSVNIVNSIANSSKFDFASYQQLRPLIGTP